MIITDNDIVIIMCGSRTWPDQHTVTQEVLRLMGRYGDRLVVRHGDEKNGADARIYRACEVLDVRHIEYCAAPPCHEEHERLQVVRAADWGRDGKRAGPIRNKAMRDAEPLPNGLVAFRMAGVSRGTDNMIALAREANIPVIVRHG